MNNSHLIKKEFINKNRISYLASWLKFANSKDLVLSPSWERFIYFQKRCGSSRNLWDVILHKFGCSCRSGRWCFYIPSAFAHYEYKNKIGHLWIEFCYSYSCSKNEQEEVFHILKKINIFFKDWLWLWRLKYIFMTFLRLKYYIQLIRHQIPKEYVLFHQVKKIVIWLIQVSIHFIASSYYILRNN